MKISIALATYNGEKYLSDQLNSFLYQTRLPDELVISDDGSSDKTLNILEEFQERAPFPVLIFRNMSERGYANNFSSALSRCSGDLVFLSDQDDVWFSDKIDYVEKLAESNPESMLFMNDAQIADATLNPLPFTKLGQINALGLDVDVFVMGCCCAVRRNLLNVCMPIPVGYRSHDDWIVFFAQGLKVKLTSNKVLQYYRRHGKNESKSIANSTSPLNRLSLWRHRFEKFSNAIMNRNDLNELKNERMLMLKGLLSAENKCEALFRSKLQEMIIGCKNDLVRVEARIKIRSHSKVFRLFLCPSYFYRGVYRNCKGALLFFQDMVS